MKNYYEILGVDRSASEEVIRKKYRKLAMEHHPDRNPDNPGAEEKFKEIAEAYGVLTDPVKRREYDAFIAGGGTRHENNGSGFSYSQEDILRDLFRDPRFQQMFQGILREFQRSGLRSSPYFLKKSFFGGKGGFFLGGLYLFGSLAGPMLLQKGKKILPEKKSLLQSIGKSVRNLIGGGAPRQTEKTATLDILYKTPLTPEEMQQGKWTEVVAAGAGKREIFRVKIPPGSKYGQKLRIKGKGRQGPDGRGDLYLQLCQK